MFYERIAREEGIQFVFKNYDTQSQTVSANTEIENA
jgi:hypothetical protein